jgi:hypothetical protein
MRSNRRKLLLSLVVLGLLGSIAGWATFSAFSATTTNPNNSFASGTVAISDNDSGTAMLSLANASPGTSDTGCIKIDYTGTLSSTVRLYATVTGTLASYLTVVVTRGTDSSPSFDSCTSFTADATNYIGAGAGVIYNGLLSAYPANYTAGLVDPLPGSPETWTTSETHSYKFVVTLVDDTAAQGLSSTAAFTWEARNL